MKSDSIKVRPGTVLAISLGAVFIGILTGFYFGVQQALKDKAQA